MALTRHAEIWLPDYVADRLRRILRPGLPPRRVWLAITDHFEPYWQNASPATALERVTRWRSIWPQISSRNLDSAGQPAQYSFFYPEEEYEPHILDMLAEIVRLGHGDVEIHIHHDNDTEAHFVEVMQSFIRRLHDVHGLLNESGGKTVFGFIHGNWALNNSHPLGRYCGLNNEISLLRDLGCYADFTMPAPDEPAQVRQVNTIYWAVDDPRRPKSHNRGPVVKAGSWEPRDLLMITGPLGPRFEPGHLLPRIEAGELSNRDPVTTRRVRRWLDLAPRVGSDVFVKLFTHGTQENVSAALLGGELDNVFRMLSAECRRRGLELHYATAWQMRQAVEAAALER